jgi:hypothetical protein
MPQPIPITGAAGGLQGSTERQVAHLLLKQGISVRAFGHRLDGRSDELRESVRMVNPSASWVNEIAFRAAIPRQS